jgi:hypothetical protein
MQQIPVQALNGTYLVWNADGMCVHSNLQARHGHKHLSSRPCSADALRLRQEHRIMGVMMGCLPGMIPLARPSTPLSAACSCLCCTLPRLPQPDRPEWLATAALPGGVCAGSFEGWVK